MLKLKLKYDECPIKFHYSLSGTFKMSRPQSKINADLEVFMMQYRFLWYRVVFCLPQILIGWYDYWILDYAKILYSSVCTRELSDPWFWKLLEIGVLSLSRWSLLEIVVLSLNFMELCCGAVLQEVAEYCCLHAELCEIVSMQRNIDITGTSIILLHADGIDGEIVLIALFLSFQHCSLIAGVGLHSCSHVIYTHCWCYVLLLCV